MTKIINKRKGKGTTKGGKSKETAKQSKRIKGYSKVVGKGKK